MRADISRSPSNGYVRAHLIVKSPRTNERQRQSQVHSSVRPRPCCFLSACKFRLTGPTHTKNYGWASAQATKL
ncbi:hypothetical protein Mapa_003565 [Marchantia paleacea]|nr:hypothetical protein Mapa_003565 [Marchantia paleacea]